MKPLLVNYIKPHAPTEREGAHSLRVDKADGTSELIKIAGSEKTRWKDAAEAAAKVRGGVTVFCLDKQGNTLRQYSLVEEDEEGEGSTSVETERKRGLAALAHDRVELAHVLAAFGAQLNEAFERGSASAGQSQDSLVSLVQMLTTHLTHAITNLHNVSVNLANVIQSTATGEELPQNGQNQQMLQQLLLMAGMKGFGVASPPTKKGEKE